MSKSVTIRNTVNLMRVEVISGNLPLMMAQGMADCNVAGGQNLQKNREVVVPQKNGTMTTDPISIRYFNFSKWFGMGIFGKGILYSRS
jgi:hypothetical protein